MDIATTSKKAAERSTYIITITFYDDRNVSVAPDTAVWSLTDPEGNIINEREQIELTELDASVDIILQGADLAILGGHAQEKRHLVIEATYSSSAGIELPLNSQLTFYVVNLKYIS